MKRILSLVLAMVMVLGSFSAVFAVEQTAAEKAVEILMDLGVLKEGKLDQDLKRQDLIVLLSRLMGEEEVAKEFPSEELAFEDVKDEFYKGYISWAVANKLTEGKSKTKFGFGDNLKTQELAMFLLRALGYGDVAFDKALEEATKLGLLVDVAEGTIAKRGMMAVMTLNALKANPKDSTVTLAEKLGLELPAPPAPTALEVKEVVANNLKEVYVTFNGVVDADTVTDSNVQVKDNKGSVVLSEDGITAVITLNAKLTNQKEYTLVVEKVKNANGLEIAKVEKKFTAFDATLPAVNSVDVTGPRNLTLTFSEPIETAGKVEVKQDKATLGNRVTVAGNKVNVEVFTNFVEGKEYTVTVTDFTDYAGYKNIINTLTFTYEKDATPPVATVEKVEQAYVVVSFNKPVKGLTKDKFYHTFSAWESVNVYKDANKTALSSTESVSKVYVYFYEGNATDKAIPAGSTVLGILGKEIKDNWGNVLGNQEFTISATADRTAPEVKEIKVVTETQLKVIFTKEVTFGSKNIEILDEAGKKIDGLYVTIGTAAPAKEYVVNLSKNLSGKTITVSIKDVKDTTLAQNILSLHSALVEITDKTAPTADYAYFKLESQSPSVVGDVYNKSRELYVTFSEPVDPETALVAGNYSLVYSDNKVVVLTSAPSFDAVSSKVKLPLTAAQANKLGGELGNGVRLQVINVKDMAGNAIVPEQKTLTGNVDTTDTIKVESAKATSKDTLVVEFNDLLSAVKPEAFQLSVGGHVYANYTLTQIDNGTTTLEFKSPVAFNTDKSNVTLTFVTGKEVKNSFGIDVTGIQGGNTITLVDKVKPEVKEITTSGYTVTITFTEAMDVVTFTKLSFGVENAKVNSISTTSNTVVLTLDKAASEVVVDGNIRISYNNDVTDSLGNALNLEKGAYKAFEVK